MCSSDLHSALVSHPSNSYAILVDSRPTFCSCCCPLSSGFCLRWISRPVDLHHHDIVQSISVHPMFRGALRIFLRSSALPLTRASYRARQSRGRDPRHTKRRNKLVRFREDVSRSLSIQRAPGRAAREWVYITREYTTVYRSPRDRRRAPSKIPQI